MEEQLLNFLAQRHMCLILDNFEPFLPARALLSRLSLYAPETTIIVTTRTRLNLQQEMIFPLKGLPLPADASMDALEQSSAVQFYCAQVRRSMIDFELTAANGASIKRIVDQVWGHPLALTMLATWAEHFSQEEIALEMEQGTNLFSAEAADIPERQQSMDRIIDAAWRKLDGDAQRVLAGLSYFACPFDRASAQAVADATPGVLRDLVGLSLLSTAQQGAYNMHPLVRHFAVAKLAEMQDADGPLAPRVARGHAKYWLGLLQRASKTDDASSVLREYQPNLAVALDWTVRHAPTLLIDSIQGPCAYWMELGYFAEAQYWLEQLLDKTEPNSAERATVLNYAVVFARRRQDFAAAEAMGREAGEIWEALGAKRELAATYEHLGWTEYDRNTGTDMARVWFEKSLALWRELGEDVRAANVLRGLASHQMTSDTRSALGILDEAAALAEQLGNETFLCKARLHRLYIAAR